MEQPLSSCTIVIFGGSGDLTHRKLVPALHSLDCEDMLPEELKVLGVSRTEYTDEELRQRLKEGVREYGRLKPEVWSDFAKRLHYMPGDYDDEETYSRLAERLEDNVLFYLAVPPMLFPIIIEHLGQVGLNLEKGGWRRVVVEKPFGSDQERARELNDQMHAVFREDQIYRIDHYLGKETVQNIMAFRFANAIFEPLWNLKYVDHVQIMVAESVGVDHRGKYYDDTGVLRDIFQNHLLQLLTLTAMEPPVVWEADALRDEKVKVLRAIRPVTRSLRGQYRGYRDEPDVDDESETATYAALELFVDNWRWRDVPFYLRSGKKLTTKATEIAIRFKQVPHLMFPLEAKEELPANVLSLCIQPDEGMHLGFETKQPGAGMETRTMEMDFHYPEGSEGMLPGAYERLLLDALQGDASLFARADEIELAWCVIDPILDHWAKPDAPPLLPYEPDTWGPEEAQDFLSGDDRTWLHLCTGH
ncbi:MAG: glucose-6-phosphate dehydrogenase [Chloroflexota bacterium]|jgi:glucose-6-phosphate 1-dehydrogenase